MKRPFLWTFLLSACGLLWIKLKMWGVLLGIGIFLLISLIVLLFYCCKYVEKRRQYTKATVVLTITMGLIICAAVRMHNHEQQLPILQCIAEQRVKIKGTGRIKQIKETDYGYVLELTRCKVFIEEKVQNCNHLILYFSRPESGQNIPIEQYHRGDEVFIQGVPAMFEQARNEGNFDEATYAYGMQRLCEFRNPEIQLIKAAPVFGRICTFLCEKAENIFETYLSKEDAGIALAMVVGNKEELSDVDETLFYDVGVGHILAISGLHLNILGMGLYGILDKVTLPLKSRCMLVVTGTLFFTMFSGAAVSSIRAFIMMGAMLFSYVVGRKYDFFSAMGLAGTVILFVSPWSLFSTSFQYSFLAVAGVGIMQFFLKKTFLKIHPLFQGFFISLGAWLFTLPVSLMTNYHVSWVGIILNVIVIPLMTPFLVLILLGFFAGVFLPEKVFLSGLTKLFFMLAEKILQLLRLICGWVGQIPYQSVISGRPTLLKAVLFVALLISILFFVGRKKKRVVLLAIPAITAWILINPYAYRGPEFVMLDVGQGDGMYIKDGCGKHFFVDGGSSNVSNVGTQRILPFFYYRKITAIDGWFVSHCDKDHISGLLEVLQSGFCVKKLFLFEGGVGNEDMEKLLELAIENKTEVVYLKTGDEIITGGITFTCLNAEAKEDINNRSLVLHLTFLPSKSQALLAGDIDGKTEKKLAETWELEEIFIWKATHHGSKYSNSENILGEMRPTIGLVSCSKNNLYGHPGQEAVDRMEDVGMQLFYTMQDGQITIRFFGEKVTICGYIIGGASCTFS